MTRTAPALLLAALLAAFALAVGARSGRAACPSVSVLAPVHYSTTAGPVEVVSADFNGDGIPDVASTGSNFEAGPGVISVFLGVGDGTLGARIDTNIGGIPLGLATADLNGDGRPDLIVGDRGNNAVRVLLGTGGGLFAPPQTFPAGDRPYEVLAADLNGDGVLDLAVADNNENSMRVLIGGRDGSGHWDGTFAPSVPYSTSALPLGITAGDFTGDGIPDLVVTESSANTVALFVNQGNGTFLSPLHVPTGSIPYELATGDLNGDGKLDLVVSATDGVRVLLGSGNGFFPAHSDYLAGENCSGVCIADIDGDGIPDLAVSTSVSAHLFTLKGNGDGTFSSPVTSTDCCFPVHLATTDLNFDGRPDFVTCDYQGNQLAVYLDGCTPDPSMPRITRIRDVPNDQGGKVFLTWTRSGLDVPGGAVNSYRVWRLIPPGVVAMRPISATPSVAAAVRSERVLGANGKTDILYWEALATLPAQRLAGYGYTAPTPQDSLPTGNPLFTYRISALTSNIDVFYDSDPDSGYSVDNLPPSEPSSFTANRNAGANHLQWNPNGEADFNHYVLYRSSNPLDAGSWVVLGTPTTNSFMDPGDDQGSYRLAAVDKHGNTSLYAASFVGVTTGVGGRPGTTWLARPSPNPTRGALAIRFNLAHAGRVSLALFDQQGRQVRTFVSGVRPPGNVSLQWNGLDDGGRPAATGLYFLALNADGQRFVERLALVH
jgi:hypothetical protein